MLPENFLKKYKKILQTYVEYDIIGIVNDYQNVYIMDVDF